MNTHTGSNSHPKSAILNSQSPGSSFCDLPSAICPRSLASTGPLLSVKELAWQMKRHPSYIYAMRQAGFSMPGNRTTLAAALDWLARNPDWRDRL
jgi:hypothetical protein